MGSHNWRKGETWKFWEHLEGAIYGSFISWKQHISTLGYGWTTFCWRTCQWQVSKALFLLNFTEFSLHCIYSILLCFSANKDRLIIKLEPKVKAIRVWRRLGKFQSFYFQEDGWQWNYRFFGVPQWHTIPSGATFITYNFVKHYLTWSYSSFIKGLKLV